VSEVDLGLFGPDSVTWRMHTEPILWIAGYRAVLLQSLHPRALAGVVQNSRFRDDPWGRLMHTARFYGEVIFGDTPTATSAGRRVRGIHARMSGIDPDTAEPFRIDEADLLRWIYVTATESFCTIAQRAGLGLTQDEVDRYYDEQRSVAQLVGLRHDDVPADAAGIEDYYRSVRPALRAGADARATARFLVNPTFPWGIGWWTPVRPLWIGVSAFAFSLLPPWARRLYGLPGLPTTDVAATLGSRTVRSVIRATLPRGAVEGPLYRSAMARAAQARSQSTVDAAAPAPAAAVREGTSARWPAASRAAARAASTTRNVGASAALSRTRTAGTANATRRLG
jgi:uncharacterized protein (DUF2236 family)